MIDFTFIFQRIRAWVFSKILVWIWLKNSFLEFSLIWFKLFFSVKNFIKTLIYVNVYQNMSKLAENCLKFYKKICPTRLRLCIAGTVNRAGTKTLFCPANFFWIFLPTVLCVPAIWRWVKGETIHFFEEIL